MPIHHLRPGMQVPRAWRVHDWAEQYFPCSLLKRTAMTVPRAQRLGRTVIERLVGLVRDATLAMLL